MSVGSSSRSWSREKGALCFEFERDGEESRVRIAQTQDPHLDAITTDEPDGRNYDDALPELPIPGSGRMGTNCGEEVPALFCPSDGCGSVYHVGHTCRKSRCPRCWKSWDFQRAKTVTSKLEALRRYRYASGDTEQKFHHLTVSFRDSTRFDSDTPVDRAAEVVKLLSHQVNVQTGYLMLHPYRIKEEYRGDVNGHESGDGDLTWKDIYGLVDDLGWDAVGEEYLVYAPHFHVIALSEFVQCGAVTEAIEEETGVVVHRVTKGADSSVSMYNLEDLCRVAAYSISHLGLQHDD
ncbi:hypothetical protein ACFPYI_20290, partial [Halomarina salina]